MRLSYISDALTELGYTNFVVIDDLYENINWVIEPSVIPSKKLVLDKISELKTKDEAENTATLNSQSSAITKLKALGLTETEAKIIIGIE